MLLRPGATLGAVLLKPKKPFKLLDRCALFVGILDPIASGVLVIGPRTWLVGLMAPPVLFCRPVTLDDTGVCFDLDRGLLSSSWVPGSPPKRGNSKEKLLLLGLLFSSELNPEARGGVRFTPVLLSDRRFRYSRSSICSLCT